MGYTTNFTGAFALDRPLLAPEAQYLHAFAGTRRMRRNAKLTAKLEDPRRIAVRLPVGAQGSYFVGAGGTFGQEKDGDILDYNSPPNGQPGLWCQWVPNSEGTRIEWDGNEKFYNYVEWLVYIIEHFLEPWGYTLNGEVEWQGEDRGDVGKLVVKGNMVSEVAGRIAYE